MKILLVHNYYGSSAPSGENKVFEAEKKLLLSHGHVVRTFSRCSDGIRGEGIWGAIKGALSTPWNPWVAKALQQEVLLNKPDVLHVHNTFPLISPSIFHAIDSSVARVLTLHNYRLFCPAAIPMRSGGVCTQCLDHQSTWPAVRFGCYRNSRLATIPLAASVALHKHLGTWASKVDAFVALTNFQRELMVVAGIPMERVYVKPNFYSGVSKAIQWSEKKASVVFVGRLSGEKGVESLIRAWLLWGAGAPELRIIGDGPLRGELEELAARNPDLPIKFLNQLPVEGTIDEISQARLLVLPSEWFETFGMVVVEAAAHGTPAAVSEIGSLPSIVKQYKSGIIFKPSDPQSLLMQVRDAWETPGLLEQLGKGARAEFEAKYTQEKNYRTLKTIYQKAIVNNKKNSRAK